MVALPLLFLAAYLYRRRRFMRNGLDGLSLDEAVPPEILNHIFQGLDPKDILLVREVSQSWRKFIDDSGIWKRKYQEKFPQPIPQHITTGNTNWMEMYFYMQTAEKNMATRRPKYTVTDIEGHHAPVQHVTCSWDTIFSADATGIIHIWNLHENRLLQSIEMSLPIQQLMITPDGQFLIIIAGNPDSGVIYVWERQFSGQWIAKWTRSYYIAKRKDRQVHVKSVEHAKISHFGSEPVLLTLGKGPYIEFWSLRDFGKHLTSIKSSISTLWDFACLQNGRVIYTIGESKCEKWILHPQRLTYEKSFETALTVFLAHPFIAGSHWSLHAKGNSHQSDQVDLFFWLNSPNGTEIKVYRIQWDHTIHASQHADVAAISQFSGHTNSMVRAVDFNSHIAIIAKESSHVIHFMTMDPKSHRPMVLPMFCNGGKVTSVFADTDKIVVGCEDDNTVHVWDFSQRKSPEAKSRDTISLIGLYWSLCTDIYSLRRSKSVSRDRLRFHRRILFNLLSILPMAIFWRHTFASLFFVALFMLNVSPLRKYSIIRLGIFYGIYRSVIDALIVSKLHGVLYYLPLLWISIMTSGLEKAMRCSSSGRALVSVPIGYYNLAGTILCIAGYGDLWENNTGVLSAILLYDYWFFWIGMSHRSLLSFEQHRIEILLWIVLPYATFIGGLILWYVNLMVWFFSETSFWTLIPPMFTLSNFILRLHMSLYPYCGNYIASTAWNPASKFMKEGGFLYMYLFLLLWVTLL
eukprot:TRINITY_DN6029_c0_g1_i1.p1 TRINITY_DN6029_c0_g1~~TRINITY_DN6029_c0_g1_i1.p1  ORF type:complete len:764 (-),score=163.78 TRINITY_DN6029_c0_g1_i1:103-2340(-)